MSCESEIVELLREAGQRPTPQRLMILSILRHREGHLTAAEILAEVRKEYPYVDVSTIYRTMSALKELRIVSETDMGSGEYSYEWRLSDPHHHLVCRRCGAELSLDTAYLEDMASRLHQDYGFRVEMDHLAIFGLCRDCTEANATD
ncbi:MAG: transcriptional repressor [Dehalococcoidia bacterium]